MIDLNRNNMGEFTKGVIPYNKITISKSEIVNLYKEIGSGMIAKHFGISKQVILRHLHEYNIPIRKPGAPLKLPIYWKQSLRKPKSVSSHLKGKTKENNETLMKISKSLKGEKSRMWRPEIHTGEQVHCACGCGKLISKYDKKGRQKYYAKSHCKTGLFTSERISGENNYNWKGGITPVNDKIRKQEQYNQWRKSVYQRDKYICQKCKEKKRNIVAHHIKSFSEYPNLRFDINNGITLCRNCHLKIHKEQKKKEYIMPKRKPLKDSSGSGTRKNQGREGCPPLKQPKKGGGR